MEIDEDLVQRAAGALRAASVVAENDAMAAGSKAAYRNALEMSRNWKSIAVELESALPIIAPNPMDSFGL